MVLNQAFANDSFSGTPIAVPANFDKTRSVTNTSPRVSLEYKASNAIKLYTTASRGFGRAHNNFVNSFELGHFHNVKSKVLIGNFLSREDTNASLRLKFNLDPIGKVLGLGAGRLHAGRDGLTGVAHAVVRQGRVGAVTMPDQLRPGFQDVKRR